VSADFPQRLCYSLAHTFRSRFKVEAIVYPAYKTSGKLEDAVLNFLTWLQEFVAERENDWLEARNAQREAKGQARLTWSERDQARVVLLGHSWVSVLELRWNLRFAQNGRTRGCGRCPSAASVPFSRWWRHCSSLASNVRSFRRQPKS
jgi:hypothetical protein